MCYSSATTLTSWHLLVTFCSLHVALWMKLFEKKPFDPRTVMGFGILNGTSIGLLNLSLGFNSVGFYQVKVVCYLFLDHGLKLQFFLQQLFSYNDYLFLHGFTNHYKLDQVVIYVLGIRQSRLVTTITEAFCQRNKNIWYTLQERIRTYRAFVARYRRSFFLEGQNVNVLHGYIEHLNVFLMSN